MKKEYDFSKYKIRKNPYARLLKKQITIRVGTEALQYFQEMASQAGVPYQSLINSYLTFCAQNKKRMQVNWV